MLKISKKASHKELLSELIKPTKVRLPDHDFAVGTRHLLVPSVMAQCQIGKDGVSYNGETYIAVRSSKHNNSSAYTHQVSE